MLRLGVTGPTTVALVSARSAGHLRLVALSRTGGTPWASSAPLAAASGSSVLSTAVGSGGSLAVLLGSRNGGPKGFVVTPGNPVWTALPRLPSSTTALALPDTPVTLDAEHVDAFTVDGASLGVYALSPSGTGWSQAQSERIPIAYGSSG